MGGDGNVLILSVYDGIDESVVAAFSSGAKITFEELKSSSGKKYIGYGIQGWLVRGAGGIQFETRSASHLIAPARRSIESVTFVGRRSAAGSTSLVLSKGDECRGIVVHLHGGPEAYETDELRLFGLSSLAVEMGWTWLSLNYRGSRAPDASVTKSAWRNWRQTFLEDLHWAIEPYGARPLVIAGWSFGAALALAASRHVQCDGLIIGGTMGSILRHFSSAVAEDPSHEEWFSRRFSLDGVDAEFFSEEIPTRRNVRVLSFHGRNDLHCPYENFSSIRKSWSSAGIAWEHHDLPEGEHFVATMEEARMLRDECLRFLNRLLLR